MSRRPIFTGPNYPPDMIMNAISGLSINITSRDFIKNTVSNGTVGGLPICYITDLQTQRSAITFNVVCINPVTMDIITARSTDYVVRMSIKKGIYLTDFNGGSTQYNISPCCVTLSYPVSVDSINTVVSCQTPLQAIVDDAKLTVLVNSDSGLMNDQLSNSKEELTDSSAVLAINGIATSSGGINIRGVGTVVVTVTGDNDEVIDD